MAAGSFFSIALIVVLVMLSIQPAPVLADESGTLTASELGVVVNDADPLSVRIGEYYRARRQVPDANILHLRFDPGAATLSEAQFAKLKRALDAATPATVQAYALTWMKPYRVDCMSITTAFAMGFDSGFCARGCAGTRLNPYFGSDSHRPHDDLHLRPAMSIATTDFDQARALIDRGLASDGTAPKGTAYLVETTDGARNVRTAQYPGARLLAQGRIQVEDIAAPALQDRNDVMFYFIGAAMVAALDSNRFLPGAVGDHLTSFGGVLDGKSQMSALRWLEAGATGSYGTVVEPCNLTAKFPNVDLMMGHYLGGDSLIEAYWKSVAMPGQGIFVGEPLARPYRH